MCFRFVFLTMTWLVAGLCYGAKKESGNEKSPPARLALPPVFFCGEPMPTHEQMVARRLVSALAHHAVQNQALYRLRTRASTFFKEIEPILRQYDIPPDFKYLPLVESALRSSATSVSGAAGYWQLMPQTARGLGLFVGSDRDDRRNLAKSTHAACRYLRQLYDQLGSWTLAAAAYNLGIGNLLRNIRRQNESDYYYLKLNSETGHYLYRIVAFKELFINYRLYGDLIGQEAIACLSRALPGAASDDPDDTLLPDGFVEEAIGAESGAVLPLPNLPAETKQKIDEARMARLAEVIHSGVRTRLVEAGGLQIGQVWIFSLTHGTELDDVRLSEGDLLYGLVEAVDTKLGKLYLRTQKAYSTASREVIPLAMNAINASTGLSGIPLPDLDVLHSGWILTWKPL